MTHDPLCPSAEQWDFPCRCALIARVQDREREQVAQEIEALAPGFGNDAMVLLVGARVARRQLP